MLVGLASSRSSSPRSAADSAELPTNAEKRRSLLFSRDLASPNSLNSTCTLSQLRLQCQAACIGRALVSFLSQQLKLHRRHSSYKKMVVQRQLLGTHRLSTKTQSAAGSHRFAPHRPATLVHRRGARRVRGRAWNRHGKVCEWIMSVSVASLALDCTVRRGYRVHTLPSYLLDDHIRRAYQQDGV